MRALALVVAAGCGRVGFTPTSDATDDVPPDVVVQPGCAAKSVGIGELHTCVLVENGTVYCTGENMFGELGTGAVSANLETPVLADRIVGAASLHAGRGFTAFIDTSDTVHCVGLNANRQCGATVGPTMLDPVSVGVPATMQLSTGYSAGCVTTTAGDVYCWGDGDEGQAGNGTDPNSHPPEVVPALAGANPVLSVGASHICSTSALGVMCWGDGLDLRLGVTGPDTCANASAGSIECALTPVAVPVPPMTSISAGDEHTCALTEPSREVWCWGSNDQGQVGVAKSPQEPPARIGTLEGIAQLVAGHDHTCVLDGDGNVACWGDNVYLQLGYTGNDSVTPIAIALPEKATSLHIGPSAYHTCAILEGGSVWCWGRGGEGQLGRSPLAATGLPAPVQLPCP